MRELELNGHVFEVRGLKRRELRELAKFGMHPTRYSVSEENFDDVMYAALDMVFPPATVDELENMDMLNLFEALIQETYSGGGAEKNSPRSGNGGQTETGSSIASDAENTTDASLVNMESPLN